MVGIASSFGYQTCVFRGRSSALQPGRKVENFPSFCSGFVLNPARDLGPRLLVWATGEGGRALWLDNQAYGIWVPTVATITGAL